MSSVEEAADAVLRLLRNPDEARRLGQLGAQRVRDHFLITRLLADELRLLQAVA